MRRIKDEKDREFGLKIIDNCIYMVLSMTGPDGLPYCVPLSPARSGETVYFHCATEGRKLECLRAHPDVSMAFVAAVEVSPREFTTYYDCALASGTAAEVADEEERREAIRLLCLKYSGEHMERFEHVLRAWAPRAAVWRVDLSTVTAKRTFPKKD